MSNTVNFISLPYEPTITIKTNDDKYIIVHDNEQKNFPILINVINGNKCNMPKNKTYSLLENRSLIFNNDNFLASGISLFCIIDSNLFTFKTKINVENKSFVKIIINRHDLKCCESDGNSNELKSNSQYTFYHNVLRADHANTNCSKTNSIILHIKKLFSDNMYVIYCGDYQYKKDAVSFIDFKKLTVSRFNGYHPEPSFKKYMDTITDTTTKEIVPVFVMINQHSEAVIIINLENGNVQKYGCCVLSKINFERFDTYYGLNIIHAGGIKMVTIPFKTSIINFYSEYKSYVLKIIAQDGPNIYSTTLKSAPFDYCDHNQFRNMDMLNEIVSDAFNWEKTVVFDFIVHNYQKSSNVIEVKFKSPDRTKYIPFWFTFDLIKNN